MRRSGARPNSRLKTILASTEPNTDRLLTAEDLAKRWQVPKAHVYRLCRERKLPHVQLGRYRRFTLAAIAEFELKGGTVAAAADAHK